MPDMVFKLILAQKAKLEFTPEDERKLLKLWEASSKKTASRSPELLAATMLWTYSSLNHLWEEEKEWTQQALAQRFGVPAKSMSAKTTELRKALKLELWDPRFCRKEFAESNPFMDMAMLENGFIVPRDRAESKNVPYQPVQPRKEDHYYDGTDWLDEGNAAEAIKCFKKALALDDEYVEAYNGLATAYWERNLKKAGEYFAKAYELTRQEFPVWPKRLDWADQANRQYLRAIHGHGLVLWRQEKSDEALQLFKLILALNPNDNQGARHLVADILAGKRWTAEEDDEEEAAKRVEEQNAKHKFWKAPRE